MKLDEKTKCIIRVSQPNNILDIQLLDASGNSNFKITPLPQREELIAGEEFKEWRFDVTPIIKLPSILKVNIISSENNPSKNITHKSHVEIIDEPIYEKNQLKLFIAKGKVMDAINRLLQITKNNLEQYNEVILQNGKFERLKKDTRMNLVDFDYTQRIREQIDNSLLELIDELDI